MEPNDLLYRIAFSCIKGMCPQLARDILAKTGPEERFFRMRETELASRLGFRNRILTDEHREEALRIAREEVRFVTNSNVRCIYFTDDDYPSRLLQCDDSPAMLYATGKTNLNAAHMVAVVGTRNASTYGVSFINRLVDDLAAKLDDVIIVSGLATGCDIASHRRAIANGIPTIGVVAHGLSTIYPAEHRNDATKIVREGGMILTDYPHSTRPHRANFLARNRIVAGMCDCIVVAESAAERGGALHTAKLGALYNRDVFALPGRTSDHYSGGCNMLIKKQIAALIENADDLIEAMNWKCRPTEGTQNELFPLLTQQQETAVTFLRDNGGEAQINTLVASLGIPPGAVMAMMTELEFKGVVTVLPGARYRLA